MPERIPEEVEPIVYEWWHYGDDGEDNLVGRPGYINYIIGRGGDDSLSGRERHDHIWGEEGNDFLSGGGGGDDTLEGGPDHDQLHGGSGADVLDGGTGNDIADYTWSNGGVVVDLTTGQGWGGDAEGDTLIGIENLIGTSWGEHGGRNEEWIAFETR